MSAFDSPLPRLLFAAQLCLVGCSGTHTNSDAGAGAGGSEPTSGGSAGLTGASGGSGGRADPRLDTSPTGGPCGQYVYADIEAFCMTQTTCALPSSPDCTLLNAQLHRSLWTTGCGYLFVSNELGEGDSTTLVYDLSTQRLVYYSTVGPQAAGCGVHGARAGQAPTCSTQVNLCPSSDGGSAGD